MVGLVRLILHISHKINQTCNNVNTAPNIWTTASSGNCIERQYKKKMTCDDTAQCESESRGCANHHALSFIVCVKNCDICSSLPFLSILPMYTSSIIFTALQEHCVIKLVTKAKATYSGNLYSQISFS